MTDEAEFEGWAILQLMGHRTRPGYLKEVEIAGTKMLRIDIPLTSGEVTEYYGPGAVYCISPCSEEIAKDAAAGIGDIRPAQPLEYQPQNTLRFRDDYDDE